MIASFLALLAAAQAPAIVRTPPPVFNPRPKSEVRTYQEDAGGWAIAIDDTLSGGCFAVRAFDEGTVVRVGINPKDNNFYIVVGNPKWRSLEVGKSYSIRWQFDSELPWDGTAHGFQFSSGGDHYLFQTFSDTEFFKEFVAKTRMTIYWETKRIATVSLDGTGQAVQATVQCQKREFNTQDPFAAAPETDDPFAKK
ncbi:hypothetical protein [Sphingobium sp. HDIP04]|uniref:hypothetical protein n=1 Tax=Sphingobium sp. HDIP04 TaxID=428994 RepID=UPI0012688254|nr:hypothetical protein [Sphingobium sp. HDIP04]